MKKKEKNTIQRSYAIRIICCVLWLWVIAIVGFGLIGYSEEDNIKNITNTNHNNEEILSSESDSFLSNSGSINEELNDSIAD